MTSLETIKKELDSRIINPEFSDLSSILDWFSKIDIDQIETRFAFEEDSYCRIPLIECNEYDLLLCCWKPGQESPFHGHPDQGCLVKILQGSLREEVRYTNGRVLTRQQDENNVGYITDRIGIHRVENTGTENAVSLHLYAPGGYKPTYQ